MIVERTPHEVIEHCRSMLGVETGSIAIDDALLIALLRHCGGMLCPCSRAVLRASLMESLALLHTDSTVLAVRINHLIDDMIVVGDFLELSDVATEDSDAKGTWVFAAPPSFVMRKSGSAFVTGIVPDQGGMLSVALDARIEYDGVTRFMKPLEKEVLAETLTEQGLHQLIQANWLKSPRQQHAEQLVDKLRQRLAREPICGPINGVEILDPSLKVTIYRDRWIKPSDQTGTFVARRPQEFGAPLWCFMELGQGIVRRMIDLPLGNYRWRGCDAAWHLQMAVDHGLGNPQMYRRSRTEGVIRLDFFSPLPAWARRRLMVLGRECIPERSLLAYELPSEEAEEEVAYLTQNLWLVREV